MNQLNNTLTLPTPARMGSYSEADVTFLLKDLSQIPIEKTNEEREAAIQKGGHYSEMLPIEYQPPAAYLELFHRSLAANAAKIAIAVGVVARVLWQKHGSQLLIASLARAGTPIGILIKRYLAYQYSLDVPHYSLSIIRGKGIDENALHYLLAKHPDLTIQFVDGWTGKGAIFQVLHQACHTFYRRYQLPLNSDLAVLADPGHCAAIYGTREDFLIPSACLNATVSGLISRTVHRPDLILKEDFHGAKYYQHLQNDDVSHLFIESITARFREVTPQIDQEVKTLDQFTATPTWEGLKSVRRIQKDFAIEDINFIKPGVGETTRVLLRRVPWKVLIKQENPENLGHILFLARERQVPVEVYPQMAYQCCGLIKPLSPNN